MSILVVGGAGYIGSQTAKRLALVADARLMVEHAWRWRQTRKRVLVSGG